MKKSILLSLSFFVCNSMQEQNLKQKFFDALEIADIECVKMCLDLDATLVDSHDEVGTYAWSKVGIRRKCALEDVFRGTEMSLYMKKYLIDTDEYNKKVAILKRENDLEKKKFEIFTYFLSLGINKEQASLVYKKCFPKWLDVVIDCKIQQMIWLICTIPIPIEQFYLITEEFEDEAFVGPEQTVELHNGYQPRKGMVHQVRDFLLWKEQPVENASKKQKIELDETVMQKHLAIACMGKTFLKEFESMCENMSLEQIAQALDADTMLMAMKTRSEAFLPLFKKILLTPDSQAVRTLNGTFDIALNDYEKWWKNGVVAIKQLKTKAMFEHRYFMMLQRKQLGDVRFNFK